MFEAFLQAARATRVTKVADLTDGYSGKPFSIFVAPTASSPKETGEVLIISAKPVRNDDATDVPVSIGDWSPVLFDAIAADGINTSAYDVYIAEIEVS